MNVNIVGRKVTLKDNFKERVTRSSANLSVFSVKKQMSLLL